MEQEMYNRIFEVETIDSRRIRRNLSPYEIYHLLATARDSGKMTKEILDAIIINIVRSERVNSEIISNFLVNSPIIDPQQLVYMWNLGKKHVSEKVRSKFNYEVALALAKNPNTPSQILINI
ncbi:MAG: hypothetical protein PHY80_03885 [Rickettsiales bacterium]|nr:hypothetical protein [Rickettsiales bacterium]